MNLYELLNSLDIEYEEIEHEPVYTIEEAEYTKQLIKGVGVKNLFLTNHKGNYYLVLIEDSKQVNLKEMAKMANTKRLSFARLEELKKILNLNLGSVTPLGLINDLEHQVIVLIDKELKEKRILVHPNTNTKTLSLEFEDLIKLIHYLKNQYIYF